MARLSYLRGQGVGQPQPRGSGRALRKMGNSPPMSANASIIFFPSYPTALKIHVRLVVKFFPSYLKASLSCRELGIKEY